MTLEYAKQQVASVLDARYANWRQFSASERVVLAFSVLVDTEHVHEDGGNNHGSWVAAILNAVQLNAGWPWCAATVEFCCQVAGVTAGPSARDAAAVVNWLAWATKSNAIAPSPSRGVLCIHINPDGATGHIGICTTVDGNMVTTLEGNTSSGVQGSQRDGDGAYRRTRDDGFWQHFVRIDV